MNLSKEMYKIRTFRARYIKESIIYYDVISLQRISRSLDSFSGRIVIEYDRYLYDAQIREEKKT